MGHGDLPIFDLAAETMPPEQRADLQAGRLSALVDRLLTAGGLQGERLTAAGITRGSDVTPGSLPGVPFTWKRDLWDTYPFGLLAVPRGEVVAVHGSSGTGGRPTLVSYTRGDLDLWSQMCARSLAAAGATAGSIVHNAYGYGLFTGGLGFHQGAVRLGATVVPVSGGMTARQLTLLRDLRPDILACTPSYAIRLGEAIAEAGSKPADVGLSAGLFGAEPWSEPMRARIQDLLGLRALDVYGLSEVIGPGVAAECLVAQDGLHVNEDHFLVEAVDPASGEPVPEGTPGELVFSTLTKEAMPLLRYRSGDIAALRRGRCACGRTLIRMTKVTGRSDDMLVIRGVNVYPAEVERVLLGDGRVSPHYLLVVDARAAVKDLVVAVESLTAAADALASGAEGSRAGADPAGQLASGLEAALRARLGVRARVRVLAAGAVPRTEVGKAVRVVTWAAGEPPLPGLADG